MSIDLIILNCHERWYGRTPLCPTGPALYGEAIATNNRGKNLIIGDLVRPMIPFTRKNFPLLKRLIKKHGKPSLKIFYLQKVSDELKDLGEKGLNFRDN